MNKLQLLPGAPNEIVFQRQFDAPRELVIRAMSTPALIKRWLGGKRAEVLSAEVDYRIGGGYRYAFRTHDGHEFNFSGTYFELSEGRVVHSERFNDQPEESRVTITLTDHGEHTTLHMVMAFSSAQMRDFVAGTGMADGAGESYDVLEGLLSEL
jgi:uncharacterized protein YndB with AHSA1/START domain